MFIFIYIGVLNQQRYNLLMHYMFRRALLFGGLRESHQAEVEIKDTNLTAFKVLLKYIYTGWLSLSSEKVSFDIQIVTHTITLVHVKSICMYFMPMIHHSIMP